VNCLPSADHPAIATVERDIDKNKLTDTRQYPTLLGGVFIRINYQRTLYQYVMSENSRTQLNYSKSDPESCRREDDFYCSTCRKNPERYNVAMGHGTSAISQMFRDLIVLLEHRQS
jgi:hypothetical protein